MIEIIKGRKLYPKKDLLIFSDLQLVLKPGKFYLIKGVSGSGKSTLLRILGLMDTLTSGTLKINNNDINKLNEKEKAILRRDTIGFVFQKFYLDPDLKAYENVMLSMLINPLIEKKERKNIAINLLKSVGLEERKNHYPSELSGGEQQRVAIARALANNPTFILADEPTGNLDKENEKQILECFRKLANQGTGIVIVSHSEIAKEYADIVYTLESGVLN